MNSRAWLPSAVPDRAVCLRRRFVQSNSAFGRHFIPDRNLARNVGAPSESRRPECSRTDERNDGVDIRGRASDKPAVFPSVNSFRSSVARHDNKWQYRDHAVEHCTGADQHSGRVQLSTRMPRHVWQRRQRGVENDRSGLYGHRLSTRNICRPTDPDKELIVRAGRVSCRAQCARLTPLVVVLFNRRVDIVSPHVIFGDERNLRYVNICADFGSNSKPVDPASS